MLIENKKKDKYFGKEDNLSKYEMIMEWKNPPQNEKVVEKS